MAVRIEPVFDELMRQAAQGDVLHNDDTSMPVLSLRREIEDDSDDSERTGVVTTGIVSTREGRKIALFFTGRQHAGENLRDVCERSLKKAILHRKNSLFYLTEKGAEVGDLFMSLIHTAELCGANPFDYLTQLQRHGEELALHPADWMPWNYLETLQRGGAALDTG